MGYDMGHLFDGVEPDASGHLFDSHPEVAMTRPDSLLYRDRIIVEPMRAVETPYGNSVEPMGEPAYCWCSLEGRTQKNSVFSENWAQDTTPQSTGGLREVTMVKILAPEWHGDIRTRVWHDGSCYEVDGSPVLMPHSTKTARHWEIQARRVYAPELAKNHIDPPEVKEDTPVWGMSV